MKHNMTKSIFTLLFLISFSAFADIKIVENPSPKIAPIQAVVTGRVASFVGGDRYQMFTCDYAEGLTTRYLSALGATNVEFNCSGGLPYQETLFVDVKFESASAVTKVKIADPKQIKTLGWTDVAITGNEECSFNTTILDNVVGQFETQNLSKTETCWDSEGDFNYSMTVIK